MNRNILVEADFPERYLEAGSDDPNAASDVPSRRTPDDYLTRLLLYIPVEIIGGYLIIAGVLQSAYPSVGAAQRTSLGVLFALGVISSYFYAQRVLKVLRTTQLVMTAVAFTVWVFTTGDLFATFAWWHPWMGTIAVVVFGVLVKLVGLGPLPPETSTSTTPANARSLADDIAD